jgi:hypothetical protein
MPGLFRSTDAGGSWTKIDSTFGGTSVFSIAVHPNQPGKLLVGSAKGLFSSINGGISWALVTSFDSVAMPFGPDADMQYYSFTAAIAVDVTYDPFDPGVIYVASHPGPVTRSLDGGQTWKLISAGMDPNEPVCDLLCDPRREGVIYASSRLSGVFVSTDRGGMWQPIVSGLERKDVVPLALSADGSVLYAGTATGSGGAGVWRLGTPSGIPEAVDARLTTLPRLFKLYQNYPNPFNPRTKIQFSIVNRQLTIVKVYDVLGREVVTLLNEVKEPGTHTVEFDGSNLSSGVYFYRLTAGDFAQTKRLVLLR